MQIGLCIKHLKPQCYLLITVKNIGVSWLKVSALEIGKAIKKYLESK